MSLSTKIYWLKILGFPFGIIVASIITIYTSYAIEMITRKGFLNSHIMRLEEKKLVLSRKKDEDLLDNIFPTSLREKLKEYSTKNQDKIMICDEYSDVTVLIVDIVGFTSLSSRVSPEELVRLLNTIFSMFDDIVKEHKMEKVRTIGDAYLCVANMTTPVVNHQEVGVKVGQRMLQTLPKLQDLFPDYLLSLRIGIATGPIVAGITGTSKWNYDIFGQTVNDAFKMESSSLPCSLTCSSPTFKSLKGKYQFRKLVQFTEGAGASKGYNLQFENSSKSGGVEKEVKNTPDSPSMTVALAKYSPVNERANLMTNSSTADIHAAFKTVESGGIGEDEITARVVHVMANSYHQLHKSRSGRRDSNERLKLQELADDNSFIRFQRELAEKELKSFAKRKVIMKFRNKKLEKEYASTLSSNSQKYMERIGYCILVALILWSLTDLTSAPGAPYLPKGVWIANVIAIISSSLFLLFVHSRAFLFLSNFTPFVTFGYLLILGLAISSQQYLGPKIIFSYYRPFIIVIVSYVFICIPQIFAFIASSLITVMAVVFYFFSARPTNDPDLANGNFLSFAIIYIIANVVAFIANSFLERGMREEFLVNRILKFSIEEQEVANRRAKLLLYNIIPRSIAKRLVPESTIVDLFNEATITFIHVNVGALSEFPLKMFSVLNDIFSEFDKKVLEEGGEKIKTINTSYMMASGIPHAKSDHTIRALKLVIAMFKEIEKYNCPYIDPTTNKPFCISLKAGMASGPVVAGVIGKSKYAYDCWSDCTNTASRMESTGTYGLIQVTEGVYMNVKDNFHFTQRGQMEIKGKGSMMTYLLNPSLL